MNCKLCNKEFSNYRELTNHLVKDHKYTAEQLYEYYSYSFETKEATCPICGKKFTMEWRQIKKHKDGISKAITCGRTCSSVFMNLLYENPSRRPEVKEKKRQTNLKHYGVENVFQAEEVKKKARKTNLKKRGVEYAMQSAEVKDKSKETNLERYNVQHVSQREDIKESKKQKSLDKYGVENVSQAEEVKELKRKKSLEKYGTEHVLQAPEVKAKGIETNLSKYKVKYAVQAPEVQEKIKGTNLERYGVEYSIQSKKVQEKIKETNVNKYGVEHAVQAPEVQEKIRETTLKNWGVKHAFSSPEIQDKSKTTIRNKYHVENVSQIPEVKQKIRESNLKNLGVEYPMQSKEVQEITKQTNLKKYGVEWSIQSEEVQEKRKKTNLDRYGTEDATQTPQAKKNRIETNMKKYGVPSVLACEEVKEQIKQTNLREYGVKYFCQHERCVKANPHRVSVINQKFSKLLKTNQIDNELEYIVEDYGYDLKVGNTLIEIDPYFTHNSLTGPSFGGKEREAKPFDYHLNKTLFAREHGFSCIHIFDWDDRDKIVYLLKPRKIVYARTCEIKEVSRKEANSFLEQYHLQGSIKSFKFAYGLYYKDELIQIMTFGKPRYNKNYEYELLRLCTKPGFSVIGGASKLLKYFEEQVNPESIISYCDLSKFEGEVYEKLGFTLKEQTKPAKHWYNPKTKRHITDNLLRQKGYDQLHSTNFGKGTSNEELMKDNGYTIIYDCGQLVFTKKRD